MPQARLKVVQGLARDFSYQTPNADGTYGCGFTSADGISAKVWVGDSEAVLATPTVAWGGAIGAITYTAAQGAPITLWTISFNSADTASLTPGVYRCQVYATHGQRTGALFDGLLEVLATPGSGTDSDLVSFTEVETVLAPLRLKEVEREMITLLKAEASDAIRKWCGQRDFTRQTYTEEYVPELNGYCALRQMPVNNVTRIRGYLQTVMTISAQPGAFQHAWISYQTSGDWYTNTLSYTGLILNSTLNGTTTASTPFLFALYPTLADLANAIMAVPGWIARTQGAFAAYPTSDLQQPGGLTAQGASTDDGCELRAYTEDLTTCKLDNATGMLWVGRFRIAGVYGYRWGPEAEVLEGFESGPIGRVQVTYDAGFSVIPTPVQLATAELVKARIQRLRKDLTLGMEENGIYKYESIGPREIADLPYPIQCGLAKWRISRAR
jgi:hypothetical protein